jgi:peptidoglycan glycosyltransferase
VNRQIKVLLTVFVICLVGIAVNLTWVQIFGADRIQGNAFNKRRLVEEYAVKRGDIISADKQTLATSEDTGAEYRYQRKYPVETASLFADVTGYDSWRYGRTGLEATFNEELLGKGPETLKSLGTRLLERSKNGNSLALTVDSRLQRAASDALGNRKGSVVALDPGTGAVLAMVSSPTYDPNVAVPKQGQDTQAEWAALNADPAKPLFNRPTSGLYPPGSSFKVVVAAAALDTGTVTPDAIYDCAGKLVVNGYTIYDFGKKTHGQLSFAQALVLSCNITFAQVGLKLGGDSLTRYAQAFGWDKPIPYDLPTEASTMASAAELNSNPVELATASFGQGEDLATPLQMAQVAAAVANGGVAMKPYLVNQVQDYNGKVIEQFAPKQLGRVMSADTAATVTGMMVDVVDHGTGTAAQINGVSVAGKTGTAEVEGAEPHAWFICFAPSSDPTLAVAVLVENGGEGGATAAPIARKVLQKARELKLL